MVGAEPARQLARTIAQRLASAGTDVLFGVPGGGANLELVGAAEDAGMRFILTHGETASCIAASSYGLLREQVGAATMTRGPGAASAVNGAAQATLDRSPLVLISDVVPAAHAARVPHQRIDQCALFAPVTKWTGTIGLGRADAVVDAAIALARTSPMGAVHLDFDPSAPSEDPAMVPRRDAAADPAALERAAELLRAAERPIVVAGAEAWPWVDEVRGFVDAVGCPVLTTYQARGLVPDGSPNVAGVFTNGAIERPLLEQADLILAVGLDPIEPIPAPWAFDAPVVSLLPWPLEYRYYEPIVELVAAIGGSLRALVDAANASGWPSGAAARAHDEAAAALRCVGGTSLTPDEVAVQLDAHLPEAATVTVDAGAHMLVAVPLLSVTRPHGMLISNGLATMGFAIPAAIGAALARPGQPVAAVTGDGGLGMVIAELETIARLDLPITVVVFDDAALSLIEIKQGSGQGGAAAVRYRNIDFASVAAAMGVPAVRVSNRAELREQLSRGWDGPRLLDVEVDPSPYRSVIRAIRG